MGLILDSSVLVAAERQGKNARQTLTAVAHEIGETDVGISVVTLIADRAGARRGSCRYARTKIEAAAVYPGTADSDAHPSHNGASGSSHGADRR
jgi:hypothetical protein